MSSYTCGRCGQEAGYQGHYFSVCHSTAWIAAHGYQMRDFHFCCPHPHGCELDAPVEYAITVQQPWAQMIAEAAVIRSAGVWPKDVENRGRPVPAKHVGYPVAIHAGLKWSDVGAADARVRRAWAAFRDAIALRQPGSDALADAVASGDGRTGAVGDLRPGLWIDQGAIIAVAVLNHCHEAAKEDGEVCCDPWGDRQYTTAKGVGPAYHLSLSQVRRLAKPVPASGRQLVPWRMPPEVAAEVTAQVVPHAVLAATFPGGA